MYYVSLVISNRRKKISYMMCRIGMKWKSGGKTISSVIHVENHAVLIIPVCG
jgi:hypothetical protein